MESSRKRSSATITSFFAKKPKAVQSLGKYTFFDNRPLRMFTQVQDLRSIFIIMVSYLASSNTIDPVCRFKN